MTYIEKNGVRLNVYLASNLDILKKRVKHKDRDALILIDGKEGTGKSTCGQQVARYLDPTFSMDRMTFGWKEFKDKCINSQPGEAIVGDEMLDLFAGRKVLSSQNVEVMQLLAKIRQKRLFIIFCSPSVFELDRYAVLHRADCLIHCHIGDYDRIGFFRFYTSKLLKRCYLEGKRFMVYSKADFDGRFEEKYYIDETSYRKKKADDLKILTQPVEKLDLNTIKKNRAIAEAVEIIKGLSGKKEKEILENLGLSGTFLSTFRDRTTIRNT